MTGEVTARRPGLHPFDFVFLLRPSALVPLWIFQLAGVAAAAGASGATLEPPGIPVRAVAGLVASTLVLGGGYILNQVRDIESDRVNRKLFLLPDGIVALSAAWIELAVVWLAAAAVSLFLPASFRWVLAASLFLSVTYSVGPVNAKSRAPLDLLWNGLEFGLVAFVAGWSSMAPVTLEGLRPVLSYLPAVAGCIASTTILDIPGDLAQGARSTGTVLGVRGTSYLALALVTLAAVAGRLISDVVGFYGALLALPLLIKAHRSGRRADRTAANQVGIGVFAILVGVRVPLLLILVAGVYLGSRAYYRARFDLAYPGKGTP